MGMSAIKSQVVGGNMPTHPSERSIKSARPVTMTVRALCAITRGRTSHAEGGLVSPGGTKTGEVLWGWHSTQLTFAGA